MKRILKKIWQFICEFPEITTGTGSYSFDALSKRGELWCEEQKEKN